MYLPKKDNGAEICTPGSEERKQEECVIGCESQDRDEDTGKHDCCDQHRDCLYHRSWSLICKRLLAGSEMHAICYCTQETTRQGERCRERSKVTEEVNRWGNK